MYECEILADSIAPSGKRLTTLQVTYPRFVHAELLTHRMFSRNSASSRAIPNTKLRQRVEEDPAMPVWWGKNVAGMQAPEELGAVDRGMCETLWLTARDEMLAHSEMLASHGLHKQLCNRLIEPWMGITVIISATEWEGFYRQRLDANAQPEIRRAAEVMRDAMDASDPALLAERDWHMPLVYEEDRVACARGQLTYHDMQKLSVARCARVSYLTHEGKRDAAADLDLYKRLITGGHWSPFEHVAQALAQPSRIGNFCGWLQHRADLDPHYIR